MPDVPAIHLGQGPYLPVFRLLAYLIGRQEACPTGSFTTPAG